MMKSGVEIQQGFFFNHQTRLNYLMNVMHLETMYLKDEERVN